MILGILLITGKSDLLEKILVAYLNWLRQGPIWAVVVVSAIVSVGCSRIVTFGIICNVVKNKKGSLNRIFWYIFAIFLFVQLSSVYLLRGAI